MAIIVNKGHRVLTGDGEFLPGSVVSGVSEKDEQHLVKDGVCRWEVEVQVLSEQEGGSQGAGGGGNNGGNGGGDGNESGGPNTGLPGFPENALGKPLKDITIADLKPLVAAITDAAVIHALIAEETAGDNRSGAVKVLNDRLEELAAGQ